MKEQVIADITKSPNRRSLFHFTRVRNLPAIAHYDALLSSFTIHPGHIGERRSEPLELTVGDYAITINPHLRIANGMLEPSITLQQFRAALDRHVFFWPTWQDCQKMLDTYSRREPKERFAILEFDAYALLMAHFSAAKLSKYDSGSSPRYPQHCSYKKSPEMWLPLEDYKRVKKATVPVRASEVKEVLIEDRVSGLSKHLKAIHVYADGTLRKYAKFSQIALLVQPTVQ